MSKIDLAISVLKSLDFSNLNQNRIIPIITSILVFVEIGYGTRIVFKGLLGENKPPQYNKLKKLIWEGNSYFTGLNYFFKDLEANSYKIQNIKPLSTERRYVQKTLAAIPGIAEVTVSLNEKNAKVKLNQDVADEVFKTAIEDAGYQLAETA